MGSITLAGRQIFILNENDRYPEPTINSPPMFAIREDEEHQHWLYVWHKGRWPLVSETPFETQGRAVDAVMSFDFDVLYK
ncbi:hypothetical protein [Serratia entomophila]|uniref:hypothetical protein n=1 Tax=Serratia entomophila TaxID=42906 RepID=UPI001F39E7C7|nr:hypothetical protein [Serratia entomophila]UIW19506.1 hypothetical protein KHA73_06030 [Serratia entomophila]CAI0691367.1 Uncharacterised protein [Serratia entomophila]CAI0801257.1 Uncharacterised protein [Serratia entomophila]CAI0873343.1 Uncharacterised protein [Serratia entomophila]CAI0883220.1 Uncharacterised protein [Serratia entomophila]